MTSPQTTEQFAAELEKSLSDQFGPMVSSRDLWKVLCYPSAGAFRQALTRNRLPVPVFEIAGRKGRFAHVRDVAWWIAKQRPT